MVLLCVVHCGKAIDQNGTTILSGSLLENFVALLDTVYTYTLVELLNSSF